MTNDTKTALVVLAVLWLLWRNESSTVDMCYVDPDTGECIPIEGA